MVNDTTLKKIFTDAVDMHQLIRIPTDECQRNYCARTKPSKVFIDILNSSSDSDDPRIGSFKEYIIKENKNEGSYLSIERNADKVIYDGQQRILFFYAFSCAYKDSLKDEKERDYFKEEWLTCHREGEYNGKPIVYTDNKDNMRAINNMFNGEIEKNDKNKLTKAYKICCRYFSENEERIKKFKTQMSSVQVIEELFKNKAEAIKSVKQAMDSQTKQKGLEKIAYPISQKLYSKNEDTQYHEYDVKWKEIRREMNNRKMKDTDKLLIYQMAILCITKNVIPEESEIVDTIDTYIEEENFNVFTFIDILEDKMRFLDNLYNFKTDSRKINEWLHRLPYKSKPLLYFALDRLLNHDYWCELSDGDKIKILDALNHCDILSSLIQHRIEHSNEEFYKTFKVTEENISSEADDKLKINFILTKIYENDIFKHVSLSLIQSQLSIVANKSAEKTLKRILYEINESYGKGNPPIKLDDGITLEHVIPRTKENEYTIVYEAGNITLLGQPMNSRLGDLDFTDKYDTLRNDTCFPINQCWKGIKKEAPKEEIESFIKERTKKIANFVYQKFVLQGN